MQFGVSARNLKTVREKRLNGMLCLRQIQPARLGAVLMGSCHERFILRRKWLSWVLSPAPNLFKKYPTWIWEREKILKDPVQTINRV